MASSKTQRNRRWRERRKQRGLPADPTSAERVRRWREMNVGVEAARRRGARALRWERVVAWDGEGITPRGALIEVQRDTEEELRFAEEERWRWEAAKTVLADWRAFRQLVLAHGGVRPDRDFPAQSIPRDLRRRHGLPADEMADTMGFETADSFIEEAKEKERQWRDALLVRAPSLPRRFAAEHRYVFLASSAGDELVDLDGLPTRRILDFLVERPDNVTNVGFATTYDVTMMLRDVPYRTLLTLWTEHRATWRCDDGREFHLWWVPQSEFSVRRDDGKRFHLWDVFKFVQGSLLRGIGAWLGEDVEDREIIVEGKEQRATFEEDDVAFMRRYTAAENRALVRIVERVREAASELDLRLRRLDGAGAIASALFEKHRVVDHFPRAGDGPPDDVLAGAYWGGRAELFRFGVATGEVWSHDIRSAYPSAATALPCLRHGRWEHSTDGRVPRYGCSRVMWETSSQLMGPAPYRVRDVGVLFPPRGHAWLWHPEVHAMLRLGIEMRVLETWEWIPEGCDRPHPFSWIADVFEARKRWASEGRTGAALMAKLGLNAVYGKLAQRRSIRGAQKARWTAFSWAGMITSTTRAQVLEAMWPHQDAIIAVATDGIIATERLPVLEGSRLGEWEVEAHDGGTFVASGIYWLGDHRVRTRGIMRGALTRENVVAAWREGAPSIKLALVRFHHFGIAGRSEERWRLTGGRWCEDALELDVWCASSPKRVSSVDPRKRPWERLVATEARPLPPWRISLAEPENIADLFAFELSDPYDGWELFARDLTTEQSVEDELL
jgi:hypothetical protein